MILDNNILCTNMFFNSSVLTYDRVERLELKNCKIDEIKIDEALIDFSTIKEEWGCDTVLLAYFQDSLEGGNLKSNGLPIQQIKIKKRKIEDLKWQDVAILKFDIHKHNYDYADRLVEALQEYEYAVQPIGEGNILGEEKYEKVECDFDGMWLVGKDEQYQFKYNSEQGDLDTISKEAVFEPIGSQYPVVVDNGKINYKKTHMKALLISQSTLDGGNVKYGQIDRKTEKKLRNDVTDFLTDKKPKIYKNSEGIYMLVRILNNPKLSPINDFQRQLYEVSMDLIEIGNANDNSTINRYFNPWASVKNVY